MLKRLITLLFALVIAFIAIALSVSNRKLVTLVLDPFTPANPLIAIDGPLYVFLFVTLIVGVLIGGSTMWLSQAKWRRMARQQTREAVRWKAEADRLLRASDAQLAHSEGTALVVAR